MFVRPKGNYEEAKEAEAVREEGGNAYDENDGFEDNLWTLDNWDDGEIEEDEV